MIKHIIKIIWSQRKANSWIFAELLIVVCAVWWMSDQLYVDMRTYYSPMGYDISNTWRFQLDLFGQNAPGYVSEENHTTTNAEDLLQLMTQIKQHPSVENVCVAFYSVPYSYGNSWTNILPVDGDTLYNEQNFQCRYVSAEYFDMFRIKDVKGKSITEQLSGAHNPVVVSEDMAQKFFHVNDASGKQLKYPGDNTEYMQIVATSVPYRNNGYLRSEPFFYKIITPLNINDYFGGNSARNAEFCVRMKQPLSQEGINDFLRDMGDRLVVNNLHVYSANSIESVRDIQISGTVNTQNRKIALMVFLLVNVLFGIIGTFWLRSQSRRGEVGLRIALGASRFDIRSFMYLEGLSILFLTIPFTLAFVLNMLYLDVPDTYRLPYTAGRFLIIYFGSYLLMSAMICIGIWLPVRRTEQIAPAEALHYE